MSFDSKDCLQKVVRRARSLVVVFREGSTHVSNFLCKQSFRCNPHGVALLARCEDWQTVQSIADAWSDFDSSSVIDSIAQLVNHGGLVVRGTAEAAKDEEYSRAWEWGESAGFYHFGIRDNQFMTGPETVKHLTGTQARRPAPRSHTTNAESSRVHRLSRPDTANPVFRTIVQRRSERQFAPTALAESHLADCLFSGLAITGFFEDPVLGRLPLKTTPSGGARNPYEAFVLMSNVQGLEPGVYHYSASEHNLGFVSKTSVTGGEILGGQEWATSAAAVIVLVANFERTMWKYSHPAAYRVVLIEAGHIAQNMVLAATLHGLAATPTAALSESIIERAIGIDSPTACPIYAIAIGVAAEDGARWSHSLPL